MDASSDSLPILVGSSGQTKIICFPNSMKRKRKKSYCANRLRKNVCKSWIWKKGTVVVPWQQINRAIIFSDVTKPLSFFQYGEVVTSYYNKVCHQFLYMMVRPTCSLYQFNILPTTNPDFRNGWLCYFSQQNEKGSL